MMCTCCSMYAFIASAFTYHMCNLHANVLSAQKVFWLWVMLVKRCLAARFYDISFNLCLRSSFARTYRRQPFLLHNSVFCILLSSVPIEIGTWRYHTPYPYIQYIFLLFLDRILHVSSAEAYKVD